MKIKTLGIGNTCCDIVNTLIESSSIDADFAIINDDVKQLNNSFAKEKLLVDKKAEGVDVQTQAEFCKYSSEIMEQVNGASTLILPVYLSSTTYISETLEVVKLSKELNKNIIVLAIKPFDFEGETALNNSEKFLKKIKEYANNIFITECEKLVLNVKEAGLSSEIYNELNTKLTNCTAQIITELVSHNEDISQLDDIARKIKEKTNAEIYFVGSKNSSNLF